MDGERLIRWMRHEAWIDLLELALVAALGVGLAYWTWLAVAPRAVAAPGTLAEAVEPRPGALAARHPFGVAQGGAPTAGRASAAPGLVLLGVVSGPDPRVGRAILAGQGSRPAIVAAGEPIADGLELREVHPDHVIVMRQGAPERIELERGKPRAVPQSVPQPVPQPPAPVRAPARR